MRFTLFSRRLTQQWITPHTIRISLFDFSMRECACEFVICWQAVQTAMKWKKEKHNNGNIDRRRRRTNETSEHFSHSATKLYIVQSQALYKKTSLVLSLAIARCVVYSRVFSVQALHFGILLLLFTLSSSTNFFLFLCLLLSGCRCSRWLFVSPLNLEKIKAIIIFFPWLERL